MPLCRRSKICLDHRQEVYPRKNEKRFEADHRKIYVMRIEPLHPIPLPRWGEERVRE